MKQLRERVAVVTGAASGIGRATSLALAREGCHLALSDVDMDGLEQTARQVRAIGRRVCAHEVDVADKERMRRYPEQVLDHHGAVHILVNNAGVTVVDDFDEHSLEDFEWLMGVNVWGVIYGCKFFLPHLKAAKEAHIVNLSSIFGIVGVPGQTAYCASKFAVRGFSEALQLELARDGIGVTSVHPGGVATDIARASRGSQAMRDAAVDVLSKGISPAEAATKIVRAIQDNKLRVLITREAHTLDWFKRAAPTGAQRWLGAQVARWQSRL